MTYVFDSSPFSALFRNFFRNRFPSLWEKFDQLIEVQQITSTREVAREIEDGPVEALREWAKDNQDVFPVPTAEEGEAVRDIFAVEHFQSNIEMQKLLKGGKNADPFVIARARVLGATVVTIEKGKPNAVKIPNICAHFHVPCLDLEGFMEAEDWRF